jgi:hypothetical protein
MDAERNQGGRGTHVAAALTAEPEVVVPGYVEDGAEPFPEDGHGAREVVPRLGDVAGHDERVHRALLPAPRPDLGGELAHPLHVIRVVGVEVGHDEHPRGRRGCGGRRCHARGRRGRRRRAAPDAARQRAQRPAPPPGAAAVVVRRVEQAVVGGGGNGQMRRHVGRGWRGKREVAALPVSKIFLPFVLAREQIRQFGDFDVSR